MNKYRKISWFLTIASALFIVGSAVMPFFMVAGTQMTSPAILKMLVCGAVLKGLMAVGVMILGYFGFKKGEWIYAALATIGAFKGLINIYPEVLKAQQSLNVFPDAKSTVYLWIGLSIIASVTFCYFYSRAFLVTLKERKA